MKVLKFGGTSVGSDERIRQVVDIFSTQEGQKMVVLSAMSGTTNTLVEICEYLDKYNLDAAQVTFSKLREHYLNTCENLCPGNEDIKQELAQIFNSYKDILRNKLNIKAEKKILSLGEMVTTIMVNQYCQDKGLNVMWLNALEFMTLTEEGEPDHVKITEKLGEILENNKADIYLTQGFICTNPKGEVDNLKRGGSDYSASIIGAAIDAAEIQIWTDIDGMHNNDPRFVPNTKPVQKISYDEAAELAYFGAKILHPSSVLPARLKSIPVYLKNTMNPAAKGTLISEETEPNRVKALAAKDGITSINIRSGRMLMAYGFLRSVFEVFERYQTAIDLITTSEVAISVTIDDKTHLQEILKDLRAYGVVSVEEEQSIVCIVGDNIGSRQGLAVDIFKALSPINIRMISFGGSQHNVSLLVGKEDKAKCLNLLNEVLF